MSQPANAAADCAADPIADAFNLHEAEVRHFVRGQVRCHATAADITQETFLHLAAKPQAQPIENLRAFVFHIARKLTIDHLRGRRRRAALDASLANLYEVTGDSPDVDRIVAAQEDLVRLQRGVQALPSQCREIFELCRFEGLSHKEIAGRLGVSVSTVEKQMALALNFLRERLQR